MSGVRAASGRGAHVAGRVAGYAFLTVVSLLCLAPLLWMIATSLKSQSAVFSGPLFPQHIQFSAYSAVWSDLGLGTYFANSVFVTGFAVVAVVLVSSIAGYAFAFLSLPGKNFIFGALMTALLLPPALFLIPAFIELRDLGLLNTRTGLALMHTGAGVPFAIYLMRSFFSAVPVELRPAALVDGASEFRVFRSIALPLCLPGVATVAIFQVLFTWNELMLSNGLIQNQKLQTIQPALYTLVGEHASNWPALTAALTMATVPVVVFFVVLQRFFVSGLTVGAVKG